MDHGWIVLSNPLDGRDDAFNDWYDHIHIRDIVRQPGAAAAQRFRLTGDRIAPGGGAVADASHGYLALYELFDPAAMTGVMDVIFSPAMRISDSFDFPSAAGGFYSVHGAIDHRLLLPGAGDVVVERIGEQTEAGFARWYREVRMPVLAALPGVAGAALFSYSDTQILPTAPDSHFVALYRLADRAALAGWGSAPPLPDGETAAVACFAPLGPRITVHDVQEIGAAERRAHEAIGDRVHRGFPVPDNA